MDISILFSLKTKFEDAAWTAGCCPFCQQLEPVRIENVKEVYSIFFIPVSSRIIGQSRRCDFCERQLNLVICEQGIPLENWSHSEGVDSLVRKLDPSGKIQAPKIVSVDRLHSLLAATKEAVSLNTLDTTFGLTTGCVLGPLVCLLIGILLYDQGLLQTQLDRLGVMGASAIIGLVLG